FAKPTLGLFCQKHMQNQTKPLVTCTRRFEWDALHRVPFHNGPCRAFHGHRYSAEITCEGPLGEDGMIIDFGVLKSLVGTWIQNNWDHTAILMEGDIDPAVSAIARSNADVGRPVYFMNSPPTAEYLALELAHVSEGLLRDTGIEV